MEPMTVEEGKVAITEEKEEELDRCCCISWKPCCPPPTEGCCGIEPESRPDLSEWVREDKYVLLIPLTFWALSGMFYLVYITDPDRFHVIRPPGPTEGSTAGSLAGLIVLALTFPLGLGVWYRGWSVAITRKINHLITFVTVPFTVVLLSEGGQNLLRLFYITTVWGTAGLTFTSSLLFLQPTRKWLFWSKIAFSAVERSEDRPYANLWTMMQLTAQTMVQTPMVEWMLSEEKGLLIFIPFLSVGLGDGLAEPVGRMWGKHKYQVRGMFTDKTYTRSYEGSACVFLFTLLAILIAWPEMNLLQLALCVLTVPLGATVAEAWSPHTFDNHLMFGIIWLLLWLIFDVLPTE